MSGRDKKRSRAWDESGRHPIAWFSALLRGVANGDPSLVDQAHTELERLGYFVVPYPPDDRKRGEVEQ